MREQMKKDINQYFVKKLYNEMNLLDETIFYEIRMVQEDANKRGILKSGMTLNSISNAIINNTFTSCKEKVNLIDEFQDYMKFNIPKKLFPDIEEIFRSHYVPFLKNKAEKTYLEHSKALFGEMKYYGTI